METKHTPGPWTIGIIDYKNRTINLNAAGWGCFVQCYFTDSLRPLEEAQANARLISAAPELLEELTTAVLRVEIANKEGNPILSAWVKDARAVIRKATGQE